ncbi:MAG: hypothetical protein HOW73_01815 [Polyangiaceae bacterium]|nr:hypothetical protein [Polyangiaceae bacterium]
MYSFAHRRTLLGALTLVAMSSASSSALALTPEEREARCADIRDVAADNGISAGFLLAGIASAETELSHCHSELSWACEGPDSPDCGGPVVAGAGDGACSLQQGGLGMFQFDGGTFDQTIARDGDGVLLLSGNVTRAVDFVVNMVMNSQYTDATTPEEAKAWMNDVTVDGPLWDAWIRTVTHYYNGCSPTACSVFNQRYAHYDEHARNVFDEQGDAFWQVEIPPCSPIPPEGRAFEETDTCFTKGGPLPYWRVGIGGGNNLHVWTGTTADAESVNYVEWDLIFDEAGQYLVEVSIPDGGSTMAAYVIDHAGATDEIIVDQSVGTEFVELGTFDFDAGDGQRIFLGDNTGEADGRKLVADTLRFTRIDEPGGGGGGGDGNGGGPGGISVGGSGEGGAGIGGGSEGGSGSDGDDDEDDGCSVAAADGSSMTSRAGILALLAGLYLVRRRDRRRTH